MIINPYSFGVAFTGLLDTYTGATAAYSLRRLRTAYTGNLIRVRRSSDNTEQDIGFLNNILDTASLLTFCGANNGFVTTWYDQSGNANDATQSTAANQPQIVSSGAMITTNSKNSIKFDGSNDFLNLSSSITCGASSFNTFVGKRDASSRILMGLSRVAANGYLWGLWSDNRYYLNSNTSPSTSEYSSSADTTTVQSLLTGINNAGTYSIFKNNNSITSTIQYFFAYTPVINAIGNNGGNYNNCNLQEIVFYNSNQASNRTGIESNINTFYSIY